MSFRRRKFPITTSLEKQKAPDNAGASEIRGFVGSYRVCLSAGISNCLKSIVTWRNTSGHSMRSR